MVPIGRYITHRTEEEDGDLLMSCRTRIYVLYCTHVVHEQATVTAAAAAAEREEESIVVLLPDVWFPLDNTLFITPA